MVIWKDGLRTDTASGSFEWWYFDAHLDDGSTLIVVFSTKPLLNRTGPLMPMVQTSVPALSGS
jgi:hypothetical protein